MAEQTRMRLSALAVLLVAVALAGCSGGGGGGANDATTTTPPATTTGGADLIVAAAPVPLTYTGCQGHAHNIAVPDTAVQPHLPAGFTPQPFLGPFIGQGATATGHDQLVVFVLTCASASQGPASETDVGEFMLYLPVTPPEELLDEGVDGYRLVVTHLSPSPLLASAFAAWNQTLADAEISASLVSAATGQAAHDEVHADGLDVTIHSGGVENGEAAATRLRYFRAEGGQLLGAVDRLLETTTVFYFGQATVTMAGASAPFGDQNASGLTGHYRWDDLALTVLPVGLPAAGA